MSITTLSMLEFVKKYCQPLLKCLVKIMLGYTSNHVLRNFVPTKPGNTRIAI